MKKGALIFILTIALMLPLASAFSSQDLVNNLSNFFHKITGKSITGKVIANEWCNGSDINHDGKVDTTDQNLLSTQWGKKDCTALNGWCNGADLNRDGKVDLSDLGLLGQNWGKTDCKEKDTTTSTPNPTTTTNPFLTGCIYNNYTCGNVDSISPEISCSKINMDYVRDSSLDSSCDNSGMAGCCKEKMKEEEQSEEILNETEEVSKEETFHIMKCVSDFVYIYCPENYSLIYTNIYTNNGKSKQYKTVCAETKFKENIIRDESFMEDSFEFINPTIKDYSDSPDGYSYSGEIIDQQKSCWIHIKNENVTYQIKNIDETIFKDNNLKIIDSAQFLPDKNWKKCVKNSSGEITAEYEYNLLSKTSIYKNGCFNSTTFRQYTCYGDSNPYFYDFYCKYGCENEKCKYTDNKCEKMGYTCVNASTFYVGKNVLQVSIINYEGNQEPLSCGTNKLICYGKTNLECIDSDNGDYYLKGRSKSPSEIIINKDSIVIGENIYYDKCYNEDNITYLKEQICNKYGTSVYRSIKCIYGCEDGACIKKEINLPEKISSEIDSDCKPVYYTGDPKNNLDLVFVGHDFTKLDDFVNNVGGQVGGILNEPTIAPYKNRINIWRVDKLGDLGCKLSEDGSLMCENKKIKTLANKCPNDFAYVIWDNFPQEKSDFCGTVWRDTKLNRIAVKFTYFLSPIIGGEDYSKYLGSAASSSDQYNGNVISHELGHLIARLPDYYLDDSKCVDHKCMMCSSNLPFSSEPLCNDKQGMVEQLNQFCDAQITYISDPYPNPWTPNSYDKNNIYWDGNVRIDYKVSLPSNSDPCYILMHVYNSNGQAVRVLVTDNVIKSSCNAIQKISNSGLMQFVLGGAKTCEDKYTFVWDGKDDEGNKVASKVYSYTISGNPNSYKTVKGTLIK
ncbi:MAG: hypothetical protein Q7R95_06475 [bacterium]|nr:hypothetical protein [bacterium]